MHSCQNNSMSILYTKLMEPTWEFNTYAETSACYCNEIHTYEFYRRPRLSSTSTKEPILLYIYEHFAMQNLFCIWYICPKRHNFIVFIACLFVYWSIRWNKRVDKLVSKYSCEIKHQNDIWYLQFLHYHVRNSTIIQSMCQIGRILIKIVECTNFHGR